MSGRNPFNWFFRFPARPCGFRASRNKKWSKFRLFLRFLALFERFFDSNTPVTTWSRMGPRNSIRGAHSRNFGTLYNPVALSIVIWIKSKLLLLQCIVLWKACHKKRCTIYTFWPWLFTGLRKGHRILDISRLLYGFRLILSINFFYFERQVTKKMHQLHFLAMTI